MVKQVNHIPSFLIVLLLTTSLLEVQGQSHPNVVFILIDDLGWKDLGCYGSTFHDTPNIDQLSREGMLFTNAYSASPVCSPSRASILTGKNPVNLGFTGHITAIGRHRYPEKGRIVPPDDYMHVSLEETMIPEMLQGLGYASASIGKWHVGDNEKYFPTHQGFDTNIAGYEHGSPPTYWGPYQSEKTWNPVIKNLSPRDSVEYLTDRLTNEAIRFISDNKERPFFLYLSHYAVHLPLEAPDTLVAKYKHRIEGQDEQKNAIYGAMVENMDWNVGRVLESISTMGLSNNTIVILSSDNGGEGKVTNNKPLREGKGYLYEGGIRIPMIVKWPGVVEESTTTDELVITDDILPTIAEMVGASAGQVDGVSLIPVLKNIGSLNRKTLHWYYPHYSPQAKMPGYAIRKGNFKLIGHYDPPSIELFDLSKDLGETTDLSSKKPKLVNELKEEFHSWLYGFDPILHSNNLNYENR